ncbi:MAG: hypothetical protein K9J81_08120, partial [Desulfohalobiaceae bacterium]|nr:hypothetical protein [Desulfohalobiaceae bacterium]
RHCERSEAIFQKSLLSGIASAKTPRPVKYWPKASAVKRHLTGRAMTGYGESVPVKRSFFTDQTGWSVEPAAGLTPDTRHLKPQKEASNITRCPKNSHFSSR